MSSEPFDKLSPTKSGIPPQKRLPWRPLGSLRDYLTEQMDQDWQTANRFIQRDYQD